VQERGRRDVTLVRIGFVALPPGDKPGFDHADVYVAGGRMYVAHTGADRIDVLDCEQGAFLRSLPGLPGVAGVLVDEEHDRLFTSDRAGARVSVFRCSDERLLGRVAVGPHPNGLAYDRRRRRVHAFNLGEPLGEHCTASVVGVEALRVVAELRLPGRPRWAVYDERRDRVYANIRAPRRSSRSTPAGRRSPTRSRSPARGRTGSRSSETGSSVPQMGERSSCSTRAAARSSSASRCLAFPTS
jgi:hypothetical protein